MNSNFIAITINFNIINLLVKIDIMGNLVQFTFDDYNTEGRKITLMHAPFVRETVIRSLKSPIEENSDYISINVMFSSFNEFLSSQVFFINAQLIFFYASFFNTICLYYSEAIMF